MWKHFDLTSHLCWHVSRCWVVRHWKENLFWCHYKPGLDTWKLDSGYDCIQCKWVEDAHCGSDLALDSVHHYLEVLSVTFYSLQHKKPSMWHWTQHVCHFRWLPESARWLLAKGKADAAHRYIMQCAEMNNRTKCMDAVTPAVHFNVDNLTVI